ncbi:unnamed protein product [Cylicocyclus nassatus]|uniref:Uncharacterized protein n=1 Tax=Cylicocyclus nassatus TaxID=53992 RepID=A0AA36GXS3_CYLNA|nr:unnamed protein product [Cylicocyclus nassatus]
MDYLLDRYLFDNLPFTVSPETRKDFIVEARELGQRELSSWRSEGLKCSDNAFWLSLADCEEEREREFKRLLKATLHWVRISKSCIAKALEDVRGYCMCEGRLVPAVNGDEDGLRWADKKAMTPEAWRQLTLREAVPQTEAVHAEKLLPF